MAEAEQFMGIRAKVETGQHSELLTGYQLDFEQEMVAVYESQKTWRFVCKQCREARGTRTSPWASLPFVTGPGDLTEADQRLQYEHVLDNIKEHVELHERMAAWYEQLHQPPAWQAGCKQGREDSGRNWGAVKWGEPPSWLTQPGELCKLCSKTWLEHQFGSGVVTCEDFRAPEKAIAEEDVPLDLRIPWDLVSHAVDGDPPAVSAKDVKSFIEQIIRLRWKVEGVSR